ncbi:MAG: DUF5667 domain-containing protein, partial [Minisyncoccia bacterium]
MEEDNLNKGIEQIKKISMTEAEKARILEYVTSSPLKKEPMQSPYAIYSFMAILKEKRVALYVSVFCLLIVGSGTVFASVNSLPGNILYPIRINILEPIHSAFIFSAEGKLNYQSDLATERLVEAETLAEDNKLDTSKETELVNLLKKNTEAVNTALFSLNQKNPSQNNNSDDIATNFQASMNAHARVLDILNNKQNGSSQNDESVANVARASGVKIIQNIKNNGSDGLNKYINKKTSVQSIIDNTSTDLEKNTNANSSQAEQNIINDTHETLNQASQLLMQAEEEENNGDSKSAYSKILDSESAAKEANIFMRTGLNFGGNS